jgi:hypothetical protein
VATTLFSLFSSHPDIMQRMDSFTWVSISNDPFLRNLIVSTAVIAWAVRLKHGSLKSLFVVVSQFTQFDILVTLHQARFFSLYPHPSGSIPPLPFIQGTCAPCMSYIVFRRLERTFASTLSGTTNSNSLLFGTYKDCGYLSQQCPFTSPTFVAKVLEGNLQLGTL